MEGSVMGRDLEIDIYPELARTIIKNYRIITIKGQKDYADRKKYVGEWGAKLQEYIRSLATIKCDVILGLVNQGIGGNTVYTR
jgi:hypothetical protein